MKKKHKRKLAVFFRQMVVVSVAISILLTGGFYMKSIIAFMGLRSEMEFVEEVAYKHVWTNELHNEYNLIKSEIINNSDPVVRWCYNCNTEAKIFTVGVLLVMLVAFLIVSAIIYIDVDYCKKRKKRRRHRMA